MTVEDLVELKQESIERINYIKNRKISALSGRNIPKSLMTAELPIRRGAFVVSVEGEEYVSRGNNTYRDVGFLGRLIGLERHLDGYKLYFTDGNQGWDAKGERMGNPRHILHPLCVDGGFYVPEEGIKVLDGGNLILVSKLGLFSGEGYADLVAEYRDRYLKVYQAYVDTKHKTEELVGQLDACNRELQTLKASREDWIYFSSELASKYYILYDTYQRFRSEYESLVTMLDKMSDVDASLRESIKYEMAALEKRINDILTLIEHYKMDESMRAELINIPKITPEYREYIKRKALTKSGLGSLKQMESELEQSENEINKLKEERQKLIMLIQQMQEKMKDYEERLAKYEKGARPVGETEEQGASPSGEAEEETEESAKEQPEEKKSKSGIVSRIIKGKKE